MTEAVKGKDRTAIRACSIKCTHCSTRRRRTRRRARQAAALSGVREFPVRVKCASLCWHTLNAALEHGASGDDIHRVARRDAQTRDEAVVVNREVRAVIVRPARR